VFVIVCICVFGEGGQEQCAKGDVDALLRKAVWFKSRGDFETAADIAENVLETNPKNVQALTFMGELLVANQETREKGYAILKYAQELDPENPRVHFVIGNCLWNHGRAAEAKQFFLFSAQSALGDEKVVFESRFALGKIYAYHIKDGDRTENLWKGLRELQRAQELSQQNAQVYFHQGLILDTLGMASEAIAAYSEAIEHDPGLTFAYANRATLLGKQGLQTDAIKSALAAVNLEPANGGLHYNLGLVLLESGDHKNALSHWQRAIELEPNLLVAHASLGNLYLDKNKNALAQRHWEITRVLASSLGNDALATAVDVRAKLGIQRVHHSLQDVSLVRKRYDDALTSLLWKNSLSLGKQRIGQGIDALSEMITDIGYYYAYLGFQNIHAREQQAQLFRTLVPELEHTNPKSLDWKSDQQIRLERKRQRVCSSTISSSDRNNVNCVCTTYMNGGTSDKTTKQWSAPIRQKKRKKVGFLSEYFNEHSVSKLIRNTIRLLSREDNDYDIVLFTLGNTGKDNYAKTLFHYAQRVIPINTDQKTMLDNVLYTRNIVRRENLDVLVFPEIGMGHLTYFVAYGRMAPVQVSFWGHPVTTGLAGTIDFFVSSQLFERNWKPQKAGRKYSESVWLMDGLSTLYPQPPKPRWTEKQEARKGIFGKYLDEHIYVCAQTAYKFHPLMDKALSNILKQDPKGILVLIASTQPEWMELVRRRIASKQETLLKRIVVISQQPLENYLALVGAAADVVLDTFPFGGGVSHFEALSVAAPVIVYAHDIPWIPQYAPGIYEYIFKNQKNTLVTHSMEEYVFTALRIASNSTLRASIRKKIQSAIHQAGIFYVEGREDNVDKLLMDWNRLFTCSMNEPDKII